MNHSSQLWLNRSRSLITIPPDNSPRSLTFSTRINRLIRYQRIIISLSNYLISSNKYFIGQQYSSQFRIERKLHAKSSFVEKFRTFEYCSLFFFFFTRSLPIDRASKALGNNAGMRSNARLLSRGTPHHFVTWYFERWP